MKVKFLLNITILLALFTFLTEGNLYSQNDPKESSNVSYVNMLYMVKKIISCDELQALLARHPEVNCTIDFSSCNCFDIAFDTTGSGIDISPGNSKDLVFDTTKSGTDESDPTKDLMFDTTASGTDKISIGCSGFFQQVSICLSKISQKETNMFNNYLKNKDNKNLLSSKELMEFNDYEQNGLMLMAKLVKLQTAVNNCLVTINSYLINKKK